MSRRPKLIPGNLYLIKDKKAWNPDTEKYCTCTYIGELKRIGQTAALYPYLDIIIQASDFRGHVPGHCHRLFFNTGLNIHKQGLTWCIQKYKEHDLPLFHNWFWNDWVLLRLKELNP